MLSVIHSFLLLNSVLLFECIIIYFLVGEAFRLLAVFSYYEFMKNKHSETSVFVDIQLHYSWVNTWIWDCRFIGQVRIYLYVKLSKHFRKWLYNLTLQHKIKRRKINHLSLFSCLSFLVLFIHSCRFEFPFTLFLWSPQIFFTIFLYIIYYFWWWMSYVFGILKSHKISWRNFFTSYRVLGWYILQLKNTILLFSGLYC